MTGKAIETLPILVAGPEHRSFILSTWVRSYQSSIRNIRFAGLPVLSDVYRDGESLVAEKHWGLSHVVTSPDDPYTIHAWVCATQRFKSKPDDPPPIGQLWHVYVPPSLRNCGVAKALVEQYAGKHYLVSKPWPRETPKGHVAHYSPYMNSQ